MYVWSVATNSQTAPVAPPIAETSCAAILWNGLKETGKVWTLCLERLQSARNGMHISPVSLSPGKIASRQNLSANSERAFVAPSKTFSKRPHNKIGFASAWVCGCGNFSVLRLSGQSHHEEMERQCPACGGTQRIAYCRLLCEPRNDTAAAPGKWVYPEVAVKSNETDDPAGRDYDWSFYDPIYFQSDRDRASSACAIAPLS
jgi:hypothetical protein